MPKKVSFYQYAQPGLQDGNYSLTANQAVASTDGSIPATIYPYESRFTVSGPRFSLVPGDLVSMFPPPFSLGEFSNVLPHAVLSRPTLPWERSLDKEIAVNDPPWLGVVLFDEGDPPPPAREGTLLDLLPASQKTDPGEKGRDGKLPPGTYFPPFPSRPGTQTPDLDYGETWDDQCMFIDIPAALFNEAMPTADDLGWLAQVREIQLFNKSETYVRKLRQTSADLDPVGQVAEVIGNRFALPGKRSIAHLVCLEQFGPVLPGPASESNLPARSGDADTTMVRVVSLKSWTYSAVSQEYTFAGLLLKVNRPGGVFTTAVLQAPFQSTGAAGDAAVSNAFKMGLAAFDHTTRLGDHTVSWFHGPFVPFNLETTIPFPGNVADQFTRYNPDAGMFDVSYSAAWQLGRLLGLQSSAYSSSLYAWKRATTQAVILSVEEEFLDLPYADMISLLQQSLSGYMNGAQAVSGASATAIAAKSAAVQAPRSITRPDRAAAVRRVLVDPAAIQARLADADVPSLPGAVAGFLARLRLLYGIPFNYLVPDERMLPSESLRFFYMDSAWVDSLLEGALSLGNSTSGDAALSQAFAPLLRQGSHAGARAIRPGLLNMPAPNAAASNPVAEPASASLGADTPAPSTDGSITPVADPTGFLLRSQVVTGWPGMEVHGFDASGTELSILRLEQVGPGVLLGIFDGVVAKLVLNEHPEALHFGVDQDVDDPDPSKFTKSFRYVTQVGDDQPGSPVPAATAPPLKIADYTRTAEASVLRIGDLAGAVQAGLKSAGVYDGPFTSAEFALEMIEGVARVTYAFGGA
ncbi:hypothetical protein [Longimicrobium sp.]|jgi:hypothetical protein|uniref:hypothetical protein n=1 Tax=Longimicrobium sp. TaxID=2029185 RepID=UPI002ED8589B